jgi:hypothetical protein
MVDLSLIRDAGAMIGPSNQSWWESLVATFGADAVEAVVDDLKERTRQPVNVATADKALRADAQAKADAEADAAEDRGDPAPVKPPDSPVRAHVNVEPDASPAVKRAVVAAINHIATTEPQAIPPARSAPPTPKEPPMNHAKLIAALKAKQKTANLTATATAEAIGISAPALAGFLSGDSTPRSATLAKIEAWVNGNDEPDAQVDTTADTVALDRKSAVVAARSAPVAVVLKAGTAHPIPQLSRADSYLDQMDALGVAISALARVDPRATATLARMYAHVADQVADSEPLASEGN